MEQLTLSMIKPDAMRRNLAGEINARITRAGLRIVAQKIVKLTKEQAAGFYSVHEGKPFFDELLTMMTSGPITAQILAGEDAINKYRSVMGATDPEKALPGTIRKEFAVSKGQNSVHGSDSEASAALEIPFFFSSLEIHL